MCCRPSLPTSISRAATNSEPPPRAERRARSDSDEGLDLGLLGLLSAPIGEERADDSGHDRQPAGHAEQNVGSTLPLQSVLIFGTILALSDAGFADFVFAGIVLSVDPAPDRDPAGHGG